MKVAGLDLYSFYIFSVLSFVFLKKNNASI